MAEQLRGEPWFHGKLSRREAEALLQLDGDFLVRESTTTPGQYVLTGLQSGQPKHLLLVDPEGVVSEAGPRVGWPKGSHGALPAACPGILASCFPGWPPVHGPPCTRGAQHRCPWARGSLFLIPEPELGPLQSWPVLTPPDLMPRRAKCSSISPEPLVTNEEIIRERS